MAGKFSIEGVFSMSDRGSRTIARIENRFDSMSRKIQAKSAAAAARMGRMFDAAGKGFQAFKDKASEPLKAIGGDLKTMGTAAIAAGAAVGAGLVSVMKTGMDFEKTLLDAGNKFQPGIEKSSALFEKLSKAAQDVGGATEFSSSQAAAALNDLADAGFDADAAIAGLPKVVDFATAASLDLTSASEVAAKALGAYGLKSNDPAELAKNLEKVTNVLMKTDALSSTSVPELFEALKEGGPVARTAGASLEEFMAIAGELGQAGIEGSSAGTTLKNMFLAISAPTDEAAAAFTRFGIKTKDARGNMRGAIDVLADLSKATSKLGTADKAAALESIFGKIPLAGVASVLDKTDTMRDNKTALENSGGQVGLVAASKRQSTQGSWDNLTSGLEAVSLGIFEIVGGPMKSLIDSTTDWIGKFKGEAIPFVKEFVGGLRDGFNAAWPAIKSAVDILFNGFGGKTEWLGRVKEFAMVLGKVAAAAAGVATVLGGMLAASIQVVTGAVNILTGAWNGVINGIGAAIFAIDDFLENVAAKWKAFNFAEWGISIVRGIVNGIKSGVGWVMDAIKGMADAMINKLKSALMINSPSKRMAKLGEFAAAGVGVGWADEMPSVDRGIEKSLNRSALMQPINALSLGSDLDPASRGLSFSGAEPAPRVQLSPTPSGVNSDDLREAVRDHLEITIRDESGRAEVTKDPKAAKVKLAPGSARSGTL